MQEIGHQQQLHLTSGASRSWECRADVSNTWFQLQWPLDIAPTEIATKELIPIILTVACWDSSLWGALVHAHSDNIAVVAVINKGSTADNKGSVADRPANANLTPVCASHNQQISGLDLQRLDKTVCCLYSNGLAPTTQRSYQSACSQYTHFCQKATAD